jgi:hypothetical protein
MGKWSARDVFTAGLASAILGYSGAALWGPLTAGSLEGIQAAQGTLALLGPILGGVLGYYFGSTTGQKIAGQAQAIASEATDARTKIEAATESRLRDAEDEARALRSEVDRLRLTVTNLRALPPPEADKETP